MVADLDGTMIDPGKALTERTHRAIADLRAAKIRFTCVSGRPPFGMRMYSDALKIRMPICGFNGGEISSSDFITLERHTIPPDVAQEVAKFFEARKLHYWIYRGSDWLVLDPKIPHADKEAGNVAFAPSVVSSFDGLWDGVTKIVGISDDHPFLEKCEQEMRRSFGGRVSAARSQLYYLDVTSPNISKETFIRYLSKRMSLTRDRIATIGDMPSDIPMFNACGLSIAMGNAPDPVKKAAHRVTATNAEDGFAQAMEEFVLGKESRAA